MSTVSADGIFSYGGPSSRGERQDSRFVLQDYVLHGTLNSRTGGPDLEPETKREESKRVRFAGDIGVDDAQTAEEYVEFLRRQGLGAPHMQPRTFRKRREDLIREFMAPKNRATLRARLQEAAPIEANRDKVADHADRLIKSYVKVLRRRPRDERPSLEQVNHDFLRDRVNFIEENPHLFADVEDTRVRYNAGEYGSMYWDANRAFNREEDDKGSYIRSKYGTSMWVSSERPSEIDRKRHNPSRGPNRSDHFLDYYHAFQERSDRVRTNIRGRTLRDTIRSDITEMSAPLEVELSSARMAGGGVSSRMSDAYSVSSMGTAAWRKVRDKRRPNRW